MVSCSLRNCDSRDAKDPKKTTGITFHRFPKDKKRRSVWIKFVDRGTWQPSKYSVICSKHFVDECFDLTSKCVVRLKDTAMPTLQQNVTWQNNKSNSHFELSTIKDLNGGHEVVNNKLQEEIMDIIQLTDVIYGKCDNKFQDGESIETCSNDADDEISEIKKRKHNDHRENAEDTKEGIIIFPEHDELNISNDKSREQKRECGYYEKKLALLERIATAEEKSAVAEQEIATHMRIISSLLVKFINK